MSRVQVRLNEISAGKISCLEVHPKRPWVASALDNGMIRIFDYVSNQLVHQFSLLDLETAEKNAQMLHAMVEKDPSYKGPRKPEVKLNKKAIGTIKVIKFIDQDIRFIKFRNEKGKADVSWAVEEKAMSLFAADWPHLLVVCGENRIFYLDYVSYALREIDMSLLDHKQVTTIEAFALEDVIAFGCVDGAVRLWHVLTGTVTKLTTNSTKPIVGMFSHYNELGSFLSVVSEDGIFAKWRLHTTAEPSVEIKEGKGSYEVLAMTFDSTEHTLILLTDKGVVVRDYYNNKELSRLRIASNSKTSYVLLKYFAHTKFSASTLFMAKDGKSLAICRVQPSSVGSLLPGINANASKDLEPVTILDSADLSKGDKEKVKMMFFDVHPTNASLVFIATTSGLAMAAIDPLSAPHFALAPAEQSPPVSAASSVAPRTLSSKTSSSSLQLQNTSQPSKIYFVNENQIWTISSAAPNDRGALVSFPSLFTALPHAGDDVRIAISATGQYLSVYYERLCKYDIYSLETKKIIDTGSRVLGIVWCQSKEGPRRSKKEKSGTMSARVVLQDVFAFLEGPSLLSQSASGVSGASSVNGAAGMNPGTSSASPNSASATSSVVESSKRKGKADAQLPPTRTITLNVKRAGNSSHDTIQTFEAPWTSTPKLFTGPFLGVDVTYEWSTSNQHASANATSSTNTNTNAATATASTSGSNNAASTFASPVPTTGAANIQFYTWGGDKIGAAMPTPLDIQWDWSSMRYCLFRYENYFCVFLVQPRFTLLARVTDKMLSSLWFNGCLFYTTRTDVKCFFASNNDSRESVISAIPTDAFTSSLLTKSQQTQENLGGCSIVELANDKLVLLSHDYRVVSILVDNPITQAYILAHSGRVTAAVQLANAHVPSRHHSALAKFMEARGRVDAAGQLSLNPHEKLQMYLRHGYLVEALAVFTSLVKQCKRGMADNLEEQDEVLIKTAQRTLHMRQMLSSAAHKLAIAGSAAGNVQIVGKVWERLARIEPTAYRHLALFYAQNGFTTQLKDLYKKLSSEANRDPAIKEEIKFVAVHISNKLLSDALLNASNSYAEYIISLHETPEREAELAEGWRARISTEIDPEALLSGLSSSAASTSFSSMMKTSESKDKSRSGVGGMAW